MKLALIAATAGLAAALTSCTAYTPTVDDLDRTYTNARTALEEVWDTQTAEEQDNICWVWNYEPTYARNNIDRAFDPDLYTTRELAVAKGAYIDHMDSVC